MFAEVPRKHRDYYKHHCSEGHKEGEKGKHKEEVMALEAKLAVQGVEKSALEDSFQAEQRRIRKALERR